MEKTITFLNSAVGVKIATIHQYFYFHFHFDDQGHRVLADLFKKTALDEIEQLEKLATRILFLKGDIDLTPRQKLRMIKSVDEMLAVAIEMENRSKRNYRKWSKQCSLLNDAWSADLFEKLALEEKVHQEQFATEIRRIRELESDYLAVF